MQVELQKVQPKRMQMQGVALWQEEEDIKQSIEDGGPCQGLMAHNERSLLRQPCLTLSHITDKSGLV